MTKVMIGIEEIAMVFSMKEATTIAGGGFKKSLHSR